VQLGQTMKGGNGILLKICTKKNKVRNHGKTTKGKQKIIKINIFFICKKKPCEAQHQFSKTGHCEVLPTENENQNENKRNQHLLKSIYFS